MHLAAAAAPEACQIGPEAGLGNGFELVICAAVLRHELYISKTQRQSFGSVSTSPAAKVLLLLLLV